jgi:hypothetical protein
MNPTIKALQERIDFLEAQNKSLLQELSLYNHDLLYINGFKILHYKNKEEEEFCEGLIISHESGKIIASFSEMLGSLTIFTCD